MKIENQQELKKILIFKQLYMVTIPTNLKYEIYLYNRILLFKEGIKYKDK